MTTITVPPCDCYACEDGTPIWDALMADLVDEGRVDYRLRTVVVHDVTAVQP